MLVALGWPFTATYFKYKKIEERYQTGKYLVDQIQKKALSIEKALYLSYELLFIFDNVTSHAVYAKDELQIGNMNKNSCDQQLFLHPGQYIRANREIIP